MKTHWKLVPGTKYYYKQAESNNLKLTCPARQFEIDMLQCNVKRTVLLFEIFCKYVIQAIGMSVMLCDLVTIEKIMRYQLCEYQLPGSFSITNITFDLNFRNKETVDISRMFHYKVWRIYCS